MGLLVDAPAAAAPLNDVAAPLLPKPPKADGAAVVGAFAAPKPPPNGDVCPNPAPKPPKAGVAAPVVAPPPNVIGGAVAETAEKAAGAGAAADVAAGADAPDDSK